MTNNIGQYGGKFGGNYNYNPVITNQLNVLGTTSDAQNQLCVFNVENGAKIVSYKCCEVEDGRLHKGGDYMFSMTVANMGECGGITKILDILSVENVGKVHFKVMDKCKPWGYKIWICGWHKHFCGQWHWGCTPLYAGLEFVICDYLPAYVFVTKGFIWPNLYLASHNMLCFGAIFQAENIHCCCYGGGYGNASFAEAQPVDDFDKEMPTADPGFKEPTEMELEAIEKEIKEELAKLNIKLDD